VAEYVREVKERRFPEAVHVSHLAAEQMKQLYGNGKGELVHENH
jgi:hypothetical protein